METIKTAKKPLGGLVLHGFTSDFNCVDGVLPRLEKLGVPYRMPALRGHQSKPEDLKGVVWKDWVDDGEKAFLDLLNECEQVVIIGLSMGSLVGIELSLKYPSKVAGLVAIAPALKAYAPSSLVGSLLAKVMKTYKFKADGSSWGDPELFWKNNKNYMQVPTASIVEFIKFTEYARKPEHLKLITVPLLVISSHNDKVVYHTEAERLYETASSKDKRIKWFDKSSHEMLLDCEAGRIFDEIESFVAELNQKLATTAK